MIPAIFGCSGLALTAEEKAFFRDVQPAGFIVFARNIETAAQLAGLTDSFRDITGRDVPVLVDQEGGRVQRMKAPNWRTYPPMQFFGDMAKRDVDLAREALQLNCQLIADDLRQVGINVDCLPLLDVPAPDGDQIIGDRAFSTDIDIIADLGAVVIDALEKGGVLPVIKHIPGHGRATVDSHKELPVVNATLDILKTVDFPPFNAFQKAAFGMTAHVIYSDIDPDHPATISPKIISDVIRGSIGFSGMLMTDDLSMQALAGSMAQRAQSSLNAGCDLVLHCNGDMAEMSEITSVLGDVPTALRAKLDDALKSVQGNQIADREALETRYDALIAGYSTQ